MLRKECLIIAEDICIGYQIESQLGHRGWRVRIVQNDMEAYERITQEFVGVVIADIDGVNLGGLAILAYCHQHTPSITTYAIAPTNDPYRKKLARDIGGCRGFFYLLSNSLRVDCSRGMGKELTSKLLSPASRVSHFKRVSE